MPQRIHEFCTFPGCGRKHHAAGYCGPHYSKHKHGVPLVEIKSRDMTLYESCKEDGCINEVVAKGLCQMHYMRLLRHGHTRYRDRKKPPRFCTSPGCENWLYAKGLCNKHYVQRRSIAKNYGLEIEDFENLQLKQRFACAICKKPETDIHNLSGKVKELAVDHCHTTGKVRGLLCGNCNRALGFFCDDPKLLKRAAAYLTKG